MSKPQRIVKRRVWVGLLGGAVSVVTWGWWFHDQRIEWEQKEPPARPFVQLAGIDNTAGGRLLLEKARLLDPTPLFFPTAWNYGQRPIEEIRLRQTGQFFVSFQPKLVMPDQGIAFASGETASAPERLSDVLSQGNEAPFAGMGQIDLRTSTLPVRSGYLEVRRLGESDAVLNQPLAGLQVPRTDFAPLEFLVIIGPAGVIGEPILTIGSGRDEVDSFFRNYLVKSYHLGERLGPGRYRVVVGA